jgi:transposase
MDNASFHKSPRIRESIESKGAKLLYLPTYSPDLNPIEHCWFYLKEKIKKIRKFCENVDGIMECVFRVSN